MPKPDFPPGFLIPELADRLQRREEASAQAGKGGVAEGREGMAEEAGPSVESRAPAAATQPVAHHEIGPCGTAQTLAELIGLAKFAETLQQTLDEEDGTGRLLAGIARGMGFEAGAGG
jgi:ferritin-like metal-binding protein YciE